MVSVITKIRPQGNAVLFLCSNRLIVEIQDWIHIQCKKKQITDFFIILYNFFENSIKFYITTIAIPSHGWS